jgi:hypothetical protein
VHIVTYRCEQCHATQSRKISEHSDGICAKCGFPMRIDDLFSDRRNVEVPVLMDRRDTPADEAA